MITILLETIINMLQGWIESFNSHAQIMEDKIDSIDSTASDIKTDADNLPDIKDNTAAVITPIQAIKSNTDSISTSSSLTASNTTAILNNIGTISTNTGSAAAYAEDCANNTLDIKDKITTIASDTTQIRSNGVTTNNNLNDLYSLIKMVNYNNIVTNIKSGLVAAFDTDRTDPLEKVVADIDYTGNIITDVNFFRLGKNYFDKTNLTTGKLINASGNEVSYADWNISDYIPVKPGAKYSILGLTTHPNTNTDNVEYFDSTKTKIGYSGWHPIDYPITIPAGVAYIKCTIKDSDLNTAMFVLGTAEDYARFYSLFTYNVDISAYSVYGGYLEITPNSAILHSTKNADGTDKSTPEEYALTGVNDFSTIFGVNNIFNDTGNITVSYNVKLGYLIEQEGL